MYTTGEIAKKCNVSVRTVQYYDEKRNPDSQLVRKGKQKMKEHKKKMVAPILITILIVLYYVLYFGVIISYLDGIMKILLGIIPLALSVVMIE
jgi:1,4-dihydroxy-2-naphthoate octaprenyltransferase